MCLCKLSQHKKSILSKQMRSESEYSTYNQTEFQCYLTEYTNKVPAIDIAFPTLLFMNTFEICLNFHIGRERGGCRTKSLSSSNAARKFLELIPDGNRDEQEAINKISKVIEIKEPQISLAPKYLIECLQLWSHHQRKASFQRSPRLTLPKLNQKWPKDCLIYKIYIANICRSID